MMKTLELFGKAIVLQFISICLVICLLVTSFCLFFGILNVWFGGTLIVLLIVGLIFIVDAINSLVLYITNDKENYE